MTDTKPIRAISIRQPYVEMILQGMKKEEYRPIITHIRERVYIYASLKPGDADNFAKIGAQLGSLPTGVIIGTVEITDCTTRKHPTKYKYVWKLKNPKRLKKPIKPELQSQPTFFKPFND